MDLESMGLSSSEEVGISISLNWSFRKALLTIRVDQQDINFTSCARTNWIKKSSSYINIAYLFSLNLIFRYFILHLIWFS